MDYISRFLIEEPYFLLLFDGVNVFQGEYFELCRILYDIDFEWILELDRDRMLDGLKLRDGVVDIPSKPCSVFEALIGMATRMGYLVEPAEGVDELLVSDMFWILIERLGLTIYTDEVIRKTPEVKATIIDILNRWMQRDFDPSGQGSPFPLNAPVKDQRLCPISYQMNAFVQEWCY